MQIGGETALGRVAGRHPLAAPQGAEHRRVRGRRRRRTSTTRSRPRSRRARCGPPPPTTSGRRCCCARRRCWPVRGATPSTRRRCSASRRPCTRRRSTRRASRSTSGATTPTSATSCCAQQPFNDAHRLEPPRVPAARGLRLRGEPVQLHVDRRQPADGADAHGQHGRLQAGDADAARLPLPDGAAATRPGCRPASINMVSGSASEISEQVLHHPSSRASTSPGRPRCSRACGKRSAQNIDRYRTYPRLVGETGGKDFVVAHESADPEALRTALDPRRLRVPGPEVLGRVARLHPAVDVEGDAVRAGRPGRRDPAGRRRRLPQLHGRGDRRQGLRQAHGRHRVREARRKTPRSSPAARATTRSAGSCGPPSSRPTTPTSSCCARSCSARSSPSTRTPTASSRRRSSCATARARTG